MTDPKPRRAPAAEARRRDADRSRERLLAAALDEFSARGYAGARVNAIAKRAGLNSQLIAYYFGGKEGLYNALIERWLEEEAELAPPGAALDELVGAYLQTAFADPRMSRLLLWTGLDAATRAREQAPATAEREDLDDLHRRQREGEIAGDLDPGLLQLALMGASLAPIALPHVARRITGVDPTDPRFQTRYVDQLRRIVRHLAANRASGE